MPDDPVDKRLALLTGVTPSQIRANLHDFAQRQVAVTQATALQNTIRDLVTAPVRASSEMRMDAKPFAQSAPAQQDRKNGPSLTLLKDAVYLDTDDGLLYYTNLYTDGRKTAV